MLHERVKARIFEIEAGVEPLVWDVGGAPLGEAAGKALLWVGSALDGSKGSYYSSSFKILFVSHPPFPFLSHFIF